jgi:GDP-L-fucose synthase
MKRILDDENPVVIWGSGNQSRAFVHARDVARGMMLLAEKAPPGEPINVGHDHEVTIKELFTLICQIVDKYPKPSFDTSKPDGYPRRAADTALLRKITGFIPAISLEDGIREMYESFVTTSKTHN